MGSGWHTKRFGKIATLVRNTVAPSEVLHLPYVGLEHIGEDSLRLVAVSTAEKVTSTKFRFQRGDILFGKLRPYFRKIVRVSFDGVCSTDIWVVRPREGIDAGYLFYLMASPAFLEPVVQSSEGTRMPRAKWEFVERLEFTIPPLPEQRAIAHILGTLDDKIERLQRMSETLEETARALFKAWFVDFVPVRAKMEGRWQRGQSLPGLPAHLYDLFPDRLVPSELGEIPEGWVVKSLDEIARFLNGLALQRYPPKGSRWLPVIKIAQLRAGHTKGADRASADVESDYIVEDGDVLFSWSGSLECVIWTGGRGALNQHLFKVTSREYPKWFYYFWIQEHLPEFRFIAASKATTMGHIQRHHLSEAKVIIAPPQVLERADLLIRPLLDQVTSVQLQSRTLATLRDALLPKLVRGEVRLGLV